MPNIDGMDISLIGFEFLSTLNLAVNGNWPKVIQCLAVNVYSSDGLLIHLQGICITERACNGKKKQKLLLLPFRYRQDLPYSLQQCRGTYFFFLA
jgi:hypothetical protein